MRRPLYERGLLKLGLLEQARCQACGLMQCAIVVAGPQGQVICCRGCADLFCSAVRKTVPEGL